MYTLRKYQEEAVEAIINDFDCGVSGGGIVVLPTGSGKTLVIAEATKRLDVHTLIICNNQELVKQNREKLEKFVDKKEIGIYSASLKTKEIRRYTVGTIGSIYKHPQLFSHFELIIVDECDCFIEDNKMFAKLLDYLDMESHLIGLTATPYRLDVENEYYGNYLYVTGSLQMLTTFSPWNRIIYMMDNWRLIKEGYILPVKVLRKDEFVDLDTLKNNSSEYDLSEYQSRFMKLEPSAINIINEVSKSHRGTIVFCNSVDQARRLSEAYNKKNEEVGLFSVNKGLSSYLHAQTPKDERQRIIDDFKSEKLSVLFNVSILTRGFDYQGLDCVVLLRPTKSFGLYTQMVGRVMRPYPGKKYGSLVDLTGTTKRFGRIEFAQIRKERNSYGLWVGDEKGTKRLDGKTIYEYERTIR